MHRRRNATAALLLVPNVTENVIRLFHHDRTFILREPITLDSRNEAGRCVVEYQPLKLEGYGETELEALHLFVDNFAAIWDHIAEEEDSKLTQRAQALKGKLRSIVERVQ